MADEKKEKLISAETADALIAAHDGDMALLCLVLERRPGTDDETAAALLCRTSGEIAAAREKLGRILGEGKKAVPARPEDEPGEYEAKEIVDILKAEEFKPILEETARILGTAPSRAYLNALVDIYDRLGMPPAVILLLLNFCDTETRRRWGPGRRPTPKSISEEAYRWANREIMTMELAEEYIAYREKLQGDKSRVAALLGIRGRELSPGETKYVESWLEMGFTDGALAEAYDRTLLKTGALKWPYMNGILKKWHAAGLHTPEQIEEAEGKRTPGGAAAPTGPLPEADREDLERILNKLKGGRA